MRRHAVLVPGFVGFDALGRIPYYSGISRIFADRRREPDAAPVSVYYFDNFPTGSVAVRGEELHYFLAKQVARGEFLDGDRVTLIGHSTGGLDIRALLGRLGRGADAVLHVDGDCAVPDHQLRALVDRVVFLSVPHYGTRGADVLAPLGPAIQRIVAVAAETVALNRGPRARFRQRVLERPPRSELGRAVRDAYQDTDEIGDATPHDLATARSARHATVAWLEHMALDLSALEDLGTQPKASRDPAERSPAHFDRRARSAELAQWSPALTTRSYATMIDPETVHPSSAIRALTRGLVAIADRSTLATVARGLSSGLSRLATRPNAALEAVLLSLLDGVEEQPFELGYLTCASRDQPFADSAFLPPSLRIFGTDERIPTSTIEPTDNDGVVNTQSMLWPWQPESPDRHSFVLVDVDHGDIIGHGPIDPPPGRRSYDLLASPRPITNARLTAVWREIYDFAASP